MKFIKIMVVSLGVMGALGMVINANVANAANITNLDSEPRTIKITQDGIRETRIVRVGETVQICQNRPCFVLFSSGTMISISGAESLNIRNDDVEMKN